VIRIIAKPEPVLEIRTGVAGLARIAYHLGNRHLAIQILPDRLIIRDDAVIAAMIAGLGGEAAPRLLPFDPEPGAYGGYRHRHHDGDHSHAHVHAYAHGQRHG
jgi:urease accessory protein